MAKDFEIINSQVIFAYQRALNIRKRQFEFEDELRDHFNVPFTSFAISDEQDGNIPRFETQSKHGFSKLQVTQFSTNLITNFREEYRTNIQNVRSYLFEKTSKLKSLISKETIDYCAFVIELGFEFNNDHEINLFIKEFSGANCIDENIYDFSLLYSKEYKNDYFLNVKCSKYVLEKYNVVNGELIIDQDKKIHGISVILDINSILASRKQKSINVDILDNLEKETFDILNSYRLEDYLKGNIK